MSIRHAFLCTVFGVLAVGPAPAAESDWYVGVSAGSISSDIDLAQLNDVHDSALFISGIAAADGTSSMDDSTHTWSVLGGHRISPNLSVEAAYVDLGEVSYHYLGEVRFGAFPSPFPVFPPVFYAGESQIVWDNSAVTVKLMGRLPFAERFDLHAQIGAAVVMTEIRSVTSVAGTPATEYVIDEDAHSTNLLYGIGAAVHLGGRWTASLDLQRYDVSEDDETPLDLEASYDSITLALLYRLGATN